MENNIQLYKILKINIIINHLYFFFLVQRKVQKDWENTIEVAPPPIKSSCNSFMQQVGGDDRAAKHNICIKFKLVICIDI